MGETGIEELPKESEEARVKLVGEVHVPEIVKIDGNVVFDRVLPNKFNINAGNTGLSLSFTEEESADKYKISADFLPGRFWESGHLSPLAATQIFCYGLSHIREWLKSSDQIDRQKIGTMRSITNPTFAQFVKKFFENGGKKIVTGENFDGPYVELDLGRFLQIPDDDSLVRKIKKLAKRAEGMKVRALVPEAV